MDYFGEQNQGNERSNSSSSSSRKGKSSSKSNKPRQPQRGLGVAQLEKIRLQSQFGCSYLSSPRGPFHPNLTQKHTRMQETYSSPPTSSSFTYNFHGHQNIMMGMGDLGDLDGGDIRYGDSQFNTSTSSIPGNGMLESQQFSQPGMTRHLMNLQVEDEQKGRKKKRNDSMGGSSSQNSETSDTQEVDLELKLSL